MTKEEILTALEGATTDELKDFNTQMENNQTGYAVIIAGGGLTTNGGDWADNFMNLSDTDKDWIKHNIASGFSIKHPCD